MQSSTFKFAQVYILMKLSWLGNSRYAIERYASLCTSVEDEFTLFFTSGILPLIDYNCSAIRKQLITYKSNGMLALIHFLERYISSFQNIFLFRLYAPSGYKPHLPFLSQTKTPYEVI